MAQQLPAIPKSKVQSAKEAYLRFRVFAEGGRREAEKLRQATAHRDL